MPAYPTYRSQVLAHLGLVAGRCDELGLGNVIDPATYQTPERRDLTAGEALKALGLNGLGFIQPARSLVPRCFQDTPTSRLISPRVIPAQRNAAALGRALDTRSASGVTALYRLIATTAAKRLGLWPTYAHLDSPSVHVEGRYNRDEQPAETVVHLTRGYSREHRPDLNHVLLALIGAHPAGIPWLMQPLRGNSRDAQDFGEGMRPPVNQLHTTAGLTYLGAESALYSAAHLPQRAATHMQWLPRVPATVRAAHAVLAQAAPQGMTSLGEGYRDQAVPST